MRNNEVCLTLFCQNAERPNGLQFVNSATGKIQTHIQTRAKHGIYCSRLMKEKLICRLLGHAFEVLENKNINRKEKTKMKFYEINKCYAENLWQSPCQPNTNYFL